MHRKIYRAIRARNAKEARSLMEQHLRMAQTAQGLERPTERRGSRQVRSAPAA
jgi:GntR family transcriptional regulator, transcriptional repressor for pyruvate dehydrogenase complex